jgi:hypothetical protein
MESKKWDDTGSMSSQARIGQGYCLSGRGLRLMAHRSAARPCRKLHEFRVGGSGLGCARAPNEVDD